MVVIREPYPQHRAVWDVLVEECGARESEFEDFVYYWPDCREFRFGGGLGSGGKVWARAHGKVDVTCYPEDENQKRHEMIEKANKRLADL